MSRSKQHNGFRFDRQEIFLTGATGVLGAHLLKQILASSHSTVHCLVRADTPEDGANRLRSILSIYDPEETLLDEFAKRVKVVLGDVAQERLGMTLEAYRSLHELVDSTIHSAACTSLFMTMRRMEPINVGGVRNILEFALKTRRKYFCYVSTYTVLGDKVFDPSIVFKESHLDIGQGFPHMAYQQTKFMAENLIRKAQGDGLKWNIVRPGQIFGEQNTGYYPQGETNVSGLFMDIFKTVIETGVAFRSTTHYDVAPVDFVSSAVLHLALERDALYETYHIMNPEVRTYSQVIDVVASLGYDIERVPQEEYKRLLMDRELRYRGEEYKSATTKGFKWWYQRDPFDFSKGAITDCSYTYRILEAAGIQCPPIDKKLIGTYIEAGIRQGYFPEPELSSRRASMPGLAASHEVFL